MKLGLFLPKTRRKERSRGETPQHFRSPLRRGPPRSPRVPLHRRRQSKRDLHSAQRRPNVSIKPIRIEGIGWKKFFFKRKKDLPGGGLPPSEGASVRRAPRRGAGSLWPFGASLFHSSQSASLPLFKPAILCDSHAVGRSVGSARPPVPCLGVYPQTAEIYLVACHSKGFALLEAERKSEEFSRPSEAKAVGCLVWGGDEGTALLEKSEGQAQRRPSL